LSTVSIVVGLNFRFWVALVVVAACQLPRRVLIYVVILRSHEGAPLSMSLLATYALSTIVVEHRDPDLGRRLQWPPGVARRRGGGFLGSMCRSPCLVRSPARSRVSVACGGCWNTHPLRARVRSVSQAPELAIISGISISWCGLRRLRWEPRWRGLPRVVATRLRHRTPTRLTLHHQGSRGDHRRRDGSYPGHLAIPLALLGVIEVVGSYLRRAVLARLTSIWLMLGCF